MTTDGTPEGTPESGGALRAQLEGTIAENRALREALAATAASSFQYVKPEDLVDVAPTELQTRAAQIEQERLEQRNSVLAEELTARGYSETQVAEFLGAKAPAAPTPQTAMASIANIGNAPARPKPGTQEGLSGPARIRAAMGD